MDDTTGQAPAHLDAGECWTLLRTAEVGRIAVSVAGRPEIFPVNFVVDHGTVVFRTAEGTKLAAVTVSPHVAFEADGRVPGDPDQAWSVVVKGRSEELRHLHDLVAADDLPLAPWHAGPKGRFVRIVPDDVTGRRFAVAGPGTWETPLSGSPRASHE
jgi:hypothetical protein